MRIADILKTKGSAVITIETTAPLSDAIALLDRERIGALLVINDDGELAGILSERDLIGVFAEYRDRAMKANVGALMTRQLYYCDPEDTAGDALRWMVSLRLRHLPVIEDGRLLGLISIGDVAKHLVGSDSKEPRRLEQKVTVGA